MMDRQIALRSDWRSLKRKARSRSREVVGDGGEYVVSGQGMITVRYSSPYMILKRPDLSPKIKYLLRTPDTDESKIVLLLM